MRPASTVDKDDSNLNSNLQINLNWINIEDASLDTSLLKLQLYFSPIKIFLTEKLINMSSFCYNIFK